MPGYDDPATAGHVDDLNFSGDPERDIANPAGWRKRHQPTGVAVRPAATGPHPESVELHRGSLAEQVIRGTAAATAEHPPRVAAKAEDVAVTPDLAVHAAASEHRHRDVTGDIHRKRRKPPSPAESVGHLGKAMVYEPEALRQGFICHGSA